MGLTPVAGSHRVREGAAYVLREAAPLVAVLAFPVAMVLALAIHAASPAAPGLAPAATPDDGFRFEQVGVGVKRLIDDGAGHRPGDRSFIFEPDREVVAFEPDGSVLLCCKAPGLILTDTSKTEIHRLGDEQPVHRWDDGTHQLQDAVDMAVAPDGTVWVTGRKLASLDADGWTIWRERSGGKVIEIGDDRAVWTDASGKTLKVLRIRGSGRHTFTPGDGLPRVTREWDPGITGIATTPDGSVWVGVSGTTAKRSGGGLLRYDGQRWKVVRPLGRGIDAHAEGVTAAEDGTLWVYLSRNAPKSADGSRRVSYLASFDGTDWTVLDEDDGIPHDGIPRHSARERNAPTILMEAGADGRVWLTPIARGYCRRLMSYRDGVTTDYLDTDYLDDACIHDFEVAADGKAWAIVEQTGRREGDDWRTDLYVVEP